MGQGSLAAQPVPRVLLRDDREVESFPARRVRARGDKRHDLKDRANRPRDGRGRGRGRFGEHASP